MGIVDAIDGADQLLATAVELAGSYAGKSKPNRALIKESLYVDALAWLRTPTDR